MFGEDDVVMASAVLVTIASKNVNINIKEDFGFAQVFKVENSTTVII